MSLGKQQRGFRADPITTFEANHGDVRKRNPADARADEEENRDSGEHRRSSVQ